MKSSMRGAEAWHLAAGCDDHFSQRELPNDVIRNKEGLRSPHGGLDIAYAELPMRQNSSDIRCVESPRPGLIPPFTSWLPNAGNALASAARRAPLRRALP